MSIALSTLEVTYSTINPSGDTKILQNSATTNFGTDTVIKIGRTGSNPPNLHRRLTNFSLSSFPQGKVIAAVFNFTSSGNGDDGEGAKVHRLLVSFVETEATWNIRSTGNNWNASGAKTAETDYTATGAASFTMPSGVSPNTTLALSIVTILQAALDAGDTTLGLLTFIDDETTISDAENINFHSREAIASNPSLSGVIIIPEPYFTWLESEEWLAPVHRTAFSVVLHTGSRSMQANDRFKLDYSLNSDMSDSTALAAQTPTDGSILTFDVTGLTVDTQHYYRIAFSTDSGTTWTDSHVIRSAHTTVAPGGEFSGIITADHHTLPLVRSENVDSNTVQMPVYDKTMDNIIAETGDARRPLSLGIDLGDTTAYTKFGASVNICPIDTTALTGANDGTGDPGGTYQPYPYGTHEKADAEAMLRIFCRETNYPFHSVPLFAIEGNHDGPHYHHRDANNSDTSDSGVVTWTAKKDYLGMNISGAASVPSITDAATHVTDDTTWNGIYRAFPYGPVLFCHLNIYWFTQHSSAQSSHELSVHVGDPLQWTLGTAQHDFFFANDGVLARYAALYPWVIFLVHNMSSEAENVSPSNYGHGHDRENEWWGIASSTTYGYSATSDIAKGVNASILRRVPRGRAIVLHGHDHVWAWDNVDGVTYLCIPQPCGTKTGASEPPYNERFSLSYGTAAEHLAVNYDGTGPSHLMLSPGHVRLDASPDGLKFSYKRSYVGGLSGVTDPLDSNITNNETIATFTMGTPRSPDDHRTRPRYSGGTHGGWGR